MDILRICGIAVLSLSMTGVLKLLKSPLSMHLTAVTVITLTVTILTSLLPIVNYLKELGNEVDGGTKIVEMVSKALGITYLCQTVSDICNDSGEKTLAYTVERAGNVAMLLLSLPVIKELVSKTLGLLK